MKVQWVSRWKVWGSLATWLIIRLPAWLLLHTFPPSGLSTCWSLYLGCFSGLPEAVPWFPLSPTFCPWCSAKLIPSPPGSVPAQPQYFTVSSERDKWLVQKWTHDPVRTNGTSFWDVLLTAVRRDSLCPVAAERAGATGAILSQEEGLTAEREGMYLGHYFSPWIQLCLKPRIEASLFN